jgi:hypothetical protein
VTFETGSRLKRIDESAFAGDGRISNQLKSIVIPSSLVALGKECFDNCMSLGSVIFETGSQLEKIDESAFRGSGLRSIVIPSSVVALGKSSFCECRSLESVTFENCTRLERIEESAFQKTGLKTIVIPSSVLVLAERSFYQCERLRSVSLENGSRLERIEEFAFKESGLRLIVLPSLAVVLGKESLPGGTVVRSSKASDIIPDRTKKWLVIPGSGKRKPLRTITTRAGPVIPRLRDRHSW